MSRPLQRTNNILVSAIGKTALNPLVTASLLYLLTKSPTAIRERLFNSVALLRDETKLVTIIKTLRWLLVLGLIGKANTKLNEIALNAWRIKSEKKRWEWNREIAVVTGGCSGIGELVVKGLVRKGVRVAILDIQMLPASLQGYASIKFFECNITDPAAVREAADKIRSTMGSPSILVNNAGIGDAHTILEASDEYLQKIFNVNLISNFTTVKAFLPDMIAKNKGQVVTVASLASFISVAGMVDYSASKAGVLAFHEGLNQEIKHRYKAPGIITTSIHPNWVRTPLIRSWEAELREKGEVLLEPKDVADAIVNQVVSCSGGQVFLPAPTKGVAGLRGWPNWMQEKLRDSLGKVVLRQIN
ncbi:NAD(P)-binding protein [Delitschia confertaspora ATCC 74209]|uniref:Short-chain dehydrogenase/reductase 3 n=1 Tax=Delitschia confertaspora ATCC 74209 TaxID=1513339 RepID=A0A9P4JUH5_9PLEO|nr:NAD(P)-binding protein [Delitschia confertaspora ATCC 74209]